MPGYATQLWWMPEPYRPGRPLDGSRYRAFCLVAGWSRPIGVIRAPQALVSTSVRSTIHAAAVVVCSCNPRGSLGEDELTKWTVDHPEFFLPFDAPAVDALTDIASWATRNYDPRVANEFLHAADSALVAYGAAHRHTIVTQEVSRSGSKKRIKIPDACASFNVRHMNSLAMLHDVGIRLVI